MKLAFKRGTNLAFEAQLDRVIADGQTSVLHEARTGDRHPQLPPVLVVKRSKSPADQVHMDFEQLACERLDHPNLATYLGSSRIEDLGTALAFERLGSNPLLVLNDPARRPRFRDPLTYAYPLPLPRAIELGFDALLALEHVHSREFVHGGVTLTNLLVRTPAGAGAPEALLRAVAEGQFEGVLAGLGGARAVSFLEGLRQGAAAPELLPHAPPTLAAPETLFERAELGGRLMYTPALDLYAFGLIFYTMVTGHLPYDHLCRPEELRDAHVVHELKVRETRGELSPIRSAFLDAVPLHDVAFCARAEQVWPGLRAGLSYVLRRCVDPDPRRRIAATEARAFFEEELGMRPSYGRSYRSWSQRTLQMRADSNRLLGDRPSGGLVLREIDGGDWAIERREATESIPVLQQIQQIPVGEGSIVAFRAADFAGKTLVGGRKGRLKEAPRGMHWLRDLLVDVQEKRPLRAKGPFLLSSAGLAPKELARCLVLPLGHVAPKLRVVDMSVQEQMRITVGRSADNDFVVPDESVSKRHAALELAGRRWWLEDLRSSNGTSLDGVPLGLGSRVCLRKSVATIRLGTSTELCFMEDAPFEKFLQSALGVVIEGIAHKAGRPTPVPRSRATPLPGSKEAIEAALSGAGFLDELPASTSQVLSGPLEAGVSSVQFLDELAREADDDEPEVPDPFDLRPDRGATRIFRRSRLLAPPPGLAPSVPLAPAPEPAKAPGASAPGAAASAPAASVASASASAPAASAATPSASAPAAPPVPPVPPASAPVPDQPFFGTTRRFSGGSSVVGPRPPVPAAPTPPAPATPSAEKTPAAEKTRTGKTSASEPRPATPGLAAPRPAVVLPSHMPPAPIPPGFAVAGPAPHPAPSAAPAPQAPSVPRELEERLRRHLVPGAFIRVVREGGRSDRADTVRAALALAGDAGETLDAVFLQLPGGERVLCHWKKDPYAT